MTKNTTTWRPRVATAVVMTVFILFWYKIASWLPPKNSNSDSKHLNGSSSSVMISVPIETVMSGEPVQLGQDDSRVSKFIWDHGYLQPASKLGYNLTSGDKDPSMGQGQMIRKIFKNMVSPLLTKFA